MRNTRNGFKKLYFRNKANQYTDHEEYFYSNDMGQSSNSVSKDNENSVVFLDQPVLIIEIIAWIKANEYVVSKDIRPQVEIIKPSETDTDTDPISYITNEWQIGLKNEYLFKRVFYVRYETDTSDRDKEFKILVHEVSKNKNLVRKTNPHTVSLMHLRSQNISHKNFEFYEEDKLQWNVTTSMQYVFDREKLYKKIFERLEERIMLIDTIVQRIEEQKTKN